MSALCDVHPLYLNYIYSQGLLTVSEMYDGSDSQNRSEEQEHLSEGSSPSNSSYYESSRSTPSNLPKAATKTRKKKIADSEDEDFVIEEVTSKKKVVNKEYGTA